jgi:glucose-6-phosphate 1-dehydrogenase
MEQQTQNSLPITLEQKNPPQDGCLLVVFGASGDLMKRLLMPSLYNLACSGLLPEHFGIVGVARTDWNTESFRERMTEDIRKFSTRPEFDEATWNRLSNLLHYVPISFDDSTAYQTLHQHLNTLASNLGTSGNILFYLATPPSAFASICENLHQAGFRESNEGWRRVIVEKPFGHDFASAVELNKLILRYWHEDQIYRIDHYLGKETVQNILAFRFANGVFESVWNRNSIDHIQLTVSESVGVEGRGDYYDRSGVMRDMIQNHLLQILSYLCMEPPSSFRPDAIRNEKVKVLESVRLMRASEISSYAVRGQYGPGEKPDGTKLAGYRQETNVDPHSKTETFAALKLFIDNWRWEGVPIYLRSGKSLWKKGTEVVIEFKKSPQATFRGTDITELEPNRLIFHIQPDQAIELRFQAKIPGPAMELQNVNMRFGYSEAFKAARGTGYEFLLYSALAGDATLFSRTDLVESCWRIAQPILDYWQREPARDFPNYPAGSWGPRSAFDLIERDGRRWIEIINRNVLQQIPIFQTADPQFLNALVLLLKPVICSAGETVVRRGEPGEEMYIISRGDVEVLNESGKAIAQLKEGNFFGEISLLLSEPRNATVRAITHCDLFTLSKDDFHKALRDHPEFATAVLDTAKTRYKLDLPK